MHRRKRLGFISASMLCFWRLINAVFIRSPLFDMKRANDMYFKLRNTDVTSSTAVGTDPLDDDDLGLLNMGVSYDGQQD